MTPSGEPPVKLLALDGGGIHGLSELLIIKRVMQRLMVDENTERKRDGQPPLSDLPKPCDYFDLIGGTSTGGIIALMLGRLRMDVNKAIKHYDTLAGIFSDPKQWADGRFKTSKLEDAIKSVVKDITGDSESPLLESDEAEICRTFVCAMNVHEMNANIPTLFRTYQSHETHLDCKVWEAARATSAAPNFFKRIEIGRTHKQPFIDGGLGRNNPSHLVLDEAKLLFGSRQIGLLLSVGTGTAKIIGIKKPGVFQRTVRTDLIDALEAIATDCEATHDTILDLFENFADTYFRLNVDQGVQEIKFSEWEKLGNAEAYTTRYMNKKEVDARLGLLVNAIKSPRGEITIEQLVSPRPLDGLSSVQHVKDRKLCPHPVVSFTGRRKILDKMHRYFDSDSEVQRVFVLYGPGGSGKSQLAFKFLQESQFNERFSGMFYIDATNEQTLEMDLQTIAPPKSVDVSLLWLANQRDGRWLLFFDNADVVHLKLKKFFPLCTFGNILITTRNQELRHCAAKGSDHQVTEMSPEDATYLLMNMSQAEETEGNKSLAAQIVQELHHFVLAVSQAGAFIHCHSSLSDYRVLYERERDNLLQNEEVQDLDPYEKAAYATWRLSYDKLDDRSKYFLQICSMLHHEGISEEMFEKAALSPLQPEDSELHKEVTKMLNHLGKQDSGWSSWDFQQVVKSLGLHSLVEYDRQNCTYSVHPLVQRWSGTTMGKNRHLMRKCVINAISSSIAWTSDQEDYEYPHALLNHITSSIALLNPTEIDSLVALGLARTYYEQRRWKDAEALQVMVMEKRKLLLGDDHPKTLISMSNLATTYSGQGRLKDAEVLEVMVMVKAKQSLGDDHPDTLINLANLASTYTGQGRWKEAEALQVVMVDKRKCLLGDDHPDTLTSMDKLATTYMNQGRWDDAEALELVVVKKRKRLLGEDHPDTLISMGDLAIIYWNQSRWRDAEVIEVMLMEKRQQLLGDDHLHTLISMANLANTYRGQGRYKDAEELALVVMEKRKQLLGDDHPDTLTGIAGLAITYSDQGRWEDAAKLGVVAMEKRKRLLGDDHLHTLISMANLANTYRGQGRCKDAEALEVVVMEKRKRLLGDDHPATLTSMVNLALTYRNLGRRQDAEVLEEVVMEKRKRRLREQRDKHPDGTLS